jgi:hypothetical protein
VLGIGVLSLSTFAGYQYLNGSKPQEGKNQKPGVAQITPTQTSQPTSLPQTGFKPSVATASSTPISPAKMEIVSNRYETPVLSFIIPDGYEVEERDPGYFFIIPNSGYSGGMEGVYIDTRTAMPVSINSKVSEAKVAFKDLEIKDLAGWKVISGTQRVEEGMTQDGMSFKDAYLDTGKQVVSIGSADKNSFNLIEPLIKSVIQKQ